MIKPRCKVGDLAIIVKPGKVPSNIGKIVHIVRVAVRGEDYCSSEVCATTVWKVYSCGSKLGVVNADGVLAFSHERSMRDYDLRPIRPPTKKRATKRVTETSEEGSI